MGPQEASCRFTSGFTFAHCDYFRFLSIIIFAFPLDYRISCFRLRFIRFGLLDSYVLDFDFYIFDFEFEIFDFDFKNSRLRLKYYCSYFCPQRNAILVYRLPDFRTRSRISRFPEIVSSDRGRECSK